MRDPTSPRPPRTSGHDEWADDGVPAELRDALRARVELGADARARLANVLASAPHPRHVPRLTRAARWLVRPLQLPMPPLAMGAAAAALLVAGVVAGERLARTRAPARTPAPVAATGAPARRVGDSAPVVRVVRFVLVAPGAQRVALVGDFNGWDAARTPMRAGGAAGVWTAELPVTAGRHLYAFVVDGTRWVVDPSAPLAPEDDFGTRNSVLVVGAET